VGNQLDSMKIYGVPQGTMEFHVDKGLFIQHHMANIMIEVTVPPGVASLAASVAGQCSRLLCIDAVHVPGVDWGRAGGYGLIGAYVDAGDEVARWENSDTPQVPYPSIDRSRPMVSDTYRTSYAECRRNDSLHMQSQQHPTLHS
jgi:hypothetical protein